MITTLLADDIYSGTQITDPISIDTGDYEITTTFTSTEFTDPSIEINYINQVSYDGGSTWENLSGMVDHGHELPTRDGLTAPQIFFTVSFTQTVLLRAVIVFTGSLHCSATIEVNLPS